MPNFRMMTSTPAQRNPTKSLIRTVILLCLPGTFLHIILLILIVIFGGHHQAFLNKNPYCQLRVPVNDGVHPPSSNTSAPPRVIIHISDLHINDIGVGNPKGHLQSFQTDVVPKWGPLAHAVVVTGDLVHAVARSPYPLGTRSIQLESEWTWLDQYASHVNQSVVFLSTHGNHDSFGGHIHQHTHLSPLSSLTCPGQRKQSYRKRVFPHYFLNNTLVLIGIDATLDRPLHRPLNFFGDARDASSQLDATLQQLEDSPDKRSRDILVFGHYPSAVMKDGLRIHAIASASRQLPLQKPRFAAYLSGHLHDFIGMSPNGLKAVSTSGALELETADMVASGAYRIVAFDNGHLSYHSFTIDGKKSSAFNPLNEIVALNLPRAGFCSAGAGTSSLKSTHIRLLSPYIDLEALSAHVEIDGLLVGPVSKFNSHFSTFNEGPDRNACHQVYGVEWNGSLFAQGVHNLTLHANGTTSAGHVFSLDGSFEKSLSASWSHLFSATFTLSDFASIAVLLSSSGLFLSILFCMPGILRRSSPSLSLAALSITFALGAPLLISKNLTVADKGYGFVGLMQTFLSSTAEGSGVDSPFIFSTRVIYPILVPASFLQLVGHWYMLERAQFPRLILVTIFFNLRSSFSWVLEIMGAHGVEAALISPSCLPLFGLCVWSALSLIRGKQF